MGPLKAGQTKNFGYPEEKWLTYLETDRWTWALTDFDIFVLQTWFCCYHSYLHNREETHDIMG